MGVDISTYRARIGSFTPRGHAVLLNGISMLFSLLSIGWLLWILLHLLISGDVETNPGPEKLIRGFLLNTQSVSSVNRDRNKLAELRALVAFYEAKIICLTETWLSPDVGDNELFPDDDFVIYRRDRSDSHGGVLMAIHSSISSKARPDLIVEDSDDFEIIVTELSLPGLPKKALVNFYNSPTTSTLSRATKFYNTLQRIRDNGFHDISVFGDFNLRNLDLTTGMPLNNEGHCREYFRAFQDFDLEHKVFGPTHKLGGRLDLILTSMPENVNDVYIEDLFTSDHSVVHFSIVGSIKRCDTTKRTVYNYKKANWLGLRNALTQSDLNSIIDLSRGNIDIACQQWTATIIDLMNKFIPKYTIPNINSPPWIDGDVIHLSNKKETARRKAQRKNTEGLWENYRKLRNELRNLTNSKYINYIKNSAYDLSNNTKRFWGVLKARLKTKSIPDKMQYRDTTANSPKSKATLFNNFFYSNFTFDDDNLVYPNITTNIDERLRDIRFDIVDIRIILDHLDVSKATGPDNIPGRVLKECAREIAPSLTKLCNLSLSLGEFPSQWKRANVVPVYKKGDRNLCDNYRPVSLLCITSKILEKAVFNKLSDILLSKLSKIQHGFLRGRSTITQLLGVINDISSNLDIAGQTDIIYLDFSKAFDSVSHKLLLHKIKKYGINGSLHKWFTSYLSGRNQRVVVEGSESPWLPVVSGVPQGSILGPMLFLLFIDDISDNISSESKMSLFADDAKLYRFIKSLHDCSILQRDLYTLENWSKIWKMNFNAKKCKIMSICRVALHTAFYQLNGTILERVYEFNDLGLIVTHDLTWSRHINCKLSKSNKNLGMVKRAVGYKAPVATKKCFYLSLVRSVLDYASIIWHPNKNDLVHIESLQRRATKYILNDYTSDYKTRLSELKLLPLCYHKEICDLSFFYKSLNGFIDFDLKSIFNFYQSTEPSTRMGSKGIMLMLGHARTERHHSFYANRMPHMWNALSQDTRQVTCKNKFVKPFRSKLFSCYSDRTALLFDVNNSCTWVTFCRCARCRPV